MTIEEASNLLGTLERGTAYLSTAKMRAIDMAREAFQDVDELAGKYADILDRYLELQYQFETLKQNELVWCVECKYKEHCSQGMKFDSDAWDFALKHPVTFCSHGERKEEEK